MQPTRRIGLLASRPQQRLSCKATPTSKMPRGGRRRSSGVIEVLLIVMSLAVMVGCSLYRPNAKESFLKRDYLTAATIWCEEAAQRRTDEAVASCEAVLELARESYPTGKLKEDLERTVSKYYGSSEQSGFDEKRLDRIVELEMLLLKEAAQRGDPHAKFALWQRASGSEADRLLREAAEGGIAEAQYKVGQIASDEDPLQKIRWWRLAADQGHLSATYQLALCYLEGSGVPQEFSAAVELFEKVAGARSLYAEDAMAHLSSLYSQGRGVPQDYVQAHMWANLAAAHTTIHSQSYASVRDDLAEKMTPQQIAEAQRLAREWMLTKAKK